MKYYLQLEIVCIVVKLRRQMHYGVYKSYTSQKARDNHKAHQEKSSLLSAFAAAYRISCYIPLYANVGASNCFSRVSVANAHASVAMARFALF
jgi:hypothetical protein